MADKLKTLKDLAHQVFEFVSDGKTETKQPCYRADVIKAEAIKWVKFLNKPVDTGEDDFYYYGNGRAAEILQKFFNITEEELA